MLNCTSHMSAVLAVAAYLFGVFWVSDSVVSWQSAVWSARLNRCCSDIRDYLQQLHTVAVDSPFVQIMSAEAGVVMVGAAPR